VKEIRFPKKSEAKKRYWAGISPQAKAAHIAKIQAGIKRTKARFQGFGEQPDGLPPKGTEDSGQTAVL
jgi:hypothetical protein